MIRFEDQLRYMIVADDDPAVTDPEIRMLLDNTLIRSSFPAWTPQTAYTVGQQIVILPRNGIVYQAQTGGTSGATQPDFESGIFVESPELGTGTITDGSVVWEFSRIELAYNLRRAAAEGWRLKAGKAANQYDFKTDVSSFQRDQLYKHCMEMYKSYRNKPGSIPVASWIATAQVNYLTSPSGWWWPVVGNQP